ncbi:hypothetical protein CQW23_34333 [Capsicum baccatum]|uniref:Uncharacterized protein n=1 Tax=Capsicum baccatum TaxID=33114 RepID=A0A2G2UZI4_CAPBA|nr:hypothetical protein CQW23_34333 [Capsicum baccatum]
MKNVAKCDTWCELQNPVNHRVFERKLRLKPLGRGHVCLGVTHRVALVRSSFELSVRRAGKAPEGTVPSPSPGRHAATALALGVARAVHQKPTGSVLGPPCPALRANPFPKLTDPFCRLPLPTLFHRPEVVHLGDLMRL